MSMRDRIRQEASDVGKLSQQQKGNTMMTKKLMELVNDGTIDNDYDIEFIQKVYEKTQAGINLSEKQEAYLEKCFNDKY